MIEPADALSPLTHRFVDSERLSLAICSRPVARFGSEEGLAGESPGCAIGRSGNGGLTSGSQTLSCTSSMVASPAPISSNITLTSPSTVAWR